MTETALGAAFKRVGADTAKDELFALASSLLHKHGLKPLRAAGPLADAVRSGGGMLAVLVDYATTRAAAIRYLDKVATDMRSDGAGHVTFDDQETHARAANSPQGEGKRGHRTSEAHGPAASFPQIRSGTGQNWLEAQKSGAGVAPKPNALERMKTAARVEASILDTYRVRERPIGDFTRAGVAHLIGRNVHETAVACTLLDRLGAGPHDIKIREILSEEEIKSAIKDAADVSEAALQKLVHRAMAISKPIKRIIEQGAQDAARH